MLLTKWLELLVALLISMVLVILLNWLDKQSTLVSQFVSEDPLVWEKDILLLEQKEKSGAGSVLFLGSSSIVRWESLPIDIAPLKSINLGFGGAKINDVVHYANRLLRAANPSAIVIFVGTNDITPAATKDPEWIFDKYRTLVSIVRARFFEIPVYYIAITPSILRWEVWPIAKQTNQLIEKFSSEDPLLHFIDTSPYLLDVDGIPNEDNYVSDGLHLSGRGYAIWADQIGSILKEHLL